MYDDSKNKTFPNHFPRGVLQVVGKDIGVRLTKVRFCGQMFVLQQIHSSKSWYED